MMNKANIRNLALLALLLSAPVLTIAQVETEVPDVVPGAKPVTVERITIHGKSLEGNLEGNEVDRPAIVYLPPSYASNPNRRYPVVYAMHGYSIGAEQWSGEIHVPQTIEGAFALGAEEMIVVLTDAKTMHNGAMYSNSVTTGRFEDYIAEDVVEYMDSNYRTLADRRSRGLVGHSMGGYGAARIGIRRTEVFGSLYMMSPCCLSARTAQPGDALEKTVAAMDSPADSADQDFFTRAQLAVAAAWSPNPENPPMYVDLPTENGELRADVLAKWAANAPLAFVDQYMEDLRSYKGIAIDVGDQDTLKVDSEVLHEAMNTYGIENSFEIYEGTHTSAVAVRFQDHVMPFFSRNLCHSANCSD